MSHGDGGSTKHSQRSITVGRFSMWKTDSVMSRNKISQQFQLYHYMIEVISPWADSKSHSQPVRSCQRFTWWTWIERTNLPCSPPPIAAAVLWIGVLYCTVYVDHWPSEFNHLLQPPVVRFQWHNSWLYRCFLDVRQGLNCLKTGSETPQGTLCWTMVLFQTEVELLSEQLKCWPWQN